MKEYQVEIYETISRVVTVCAKDEDNAIDRVAERYSNSEYILDASDFQDVEFNLV
ncbi:DpnD/PcfM family protein [Candidatus Pacearchaeota archaeon]|nr:DpnD/PcfM family protein [Candidatus Pacearchaeota archaeon]